MAADGHNNEAAVAAAAAAAAAIVQVDDSSGAATVITSVHSNEQSPTHTFIDSTTAALKNDTDQVPHETGSKIDGRMKSEDQYFDEKKKAKKTKLSREEQLAARRAKDRERYASMTLEQRENYNLKRRKQYHCQSELSRQNRRNRERERYHSLDAEAAKKRNKKRAKLERERYQRLTPEQLETRNAKRRERSAKARQKKRDELEKRKGAGILNQDGGNNQSNQNLTSLNSENNDAVLYKSGAETDRKSVV